MILGAEFVDRIDWTEPVTILYHTEHELADGVNIYRIILNEPLP